MHLNKLKDIKQFKGEVFKLGVIGQDDSELDALSDTDGEQDKEESKTEMVGFDIDSKVKGGRLALLYRGHGAKPQVWF